MNIDELKQALNTIAEDVDSPIAADTAQRLAGVDMLQKRVRRTRAFAGSAVAVAAVAAVVLAPSLLPGDSGQGPEPAQRTTHKPVQDDRRGSNTAIDQTPLPTIEDHGAVFYTVPAGNVLLGHVVGRPGQRHLTLTVTPSTTDLSWVDFCWQRHSSGDLEFRTFVNGDLVTASSCGQAYGPLQGEGMFSANPAANKRQWERYGVQSGTPMTIDVRLKAGHGASARTLSNAQPGIAVYERPETTLEEHGVWFDKQVVYHGHTYAFRGSDFADVVDARADTSLVLPQSDHRVLVVEGMAGDTRGRVDLLHNDKVTQTFFNGLRSGGVTSSSRLARAGEPFDYAIHTRRAGLGAAQAYLLAYERID